MATDDAVILFDIDGTLIDSTYHHAVAWHRAFHRDDLPIPLWRIHRAIGMGGDKLVGAVAGDQVEQSRGDAIRDAWAEEYSQIKAEVLPLPGASSLVREAVASGYRVALASSGEKKFSEEAVEMLGVGDAITLLTTAADADATKPDADLLRTTLARTGAKRSVLVGDTPYDVEAAARTGIACIAVRTGGFSEGELTEAGAVLVGDGPEDLAGIDWEQYLREVGPRDGGSPSDR
jgi:HAD superfamily hydrolase (TIGR01549 family)